MGTLQLETPYLTTTTTAATTDREKNLDLNEDDISPIEEVRLTVTNTDDPTLPVWTFRMWFLGLFSCALLSFLNQFFSYRTEPLIISQITVQVASLPIGHFLAAVLPTTKFRIPGFGSRLFSLNPSPFNMKEHVLISIFANAGSAFGSGSAYAVGIITIIKAFYQRKISFLAGWLLITTTQVSLFVLLLWESKENNWYNRTFAFIIFGHFHWLIMVGGFSIVGVGVRLGWFVAEICGGTRTHVVARHSRSGLAFPVSRSCLHLCLYNSLTVWWIALIFNIKIHSLIYGHVMLKRLILALNRVLLILM